MLFMYLFISQSLFGSYINVCVGGGGCPFDGFLRYIKLLAVLILGFANSIIHFVGLINGATNMVVLLKLE
jgi:hypothetical protein